jgi:hypothetical protein
VFLDISCVYNALHAHTSREAPVDWLCCDLVHVNGRVARLLLRDAVPGVDFESEWFGRHISTWIGLL